MGGNWRQGRAFREVRQDDAEKKACQKLIEYIVMHVFFISRYDSFMSPNDTTCNIQRVIYNVQYNVLRCSRYNSLWHRNGVDPAV